MIQAAQTQEYIERYKTVVLIAILVIFHAVGLFGLSSDLREDFLPLSFFNLLLSFVVVWFGRFSTPKGWYQFVLIGFLIGMIAEWIGVHTGWFFGTYIYGENLGIKLFGVPFIIGLNWVLLTVISAAVAQKFKTTKALSILLGAVFMLILDILIEPVAIVSDYWTWQGDIPFSNFITWFVVALFLQFIYNVMDLAENNKVAISLYLIQVIFFSVLNLVL